MLDLVDSDYPILSQVTMLSSTTFQTDMTPPCIFFLQVTNSLGKDWQLELMDYNPQFPQYMKKNLS